MADLLRLIKNPGIANSAGKSIKGFKSGKSVSESIKMAYTIHIRDRDDSSSSDNKSGSISDIDDDLKKTHLVTRWKKSRSVSPIKCSHLSASTLSRHHSSNCKPLSTSTRLSTTTKPGQYSDTEEPSIPFTATFQSLQDPKPNPITPPRAQPASENSNTLIPVDPDTQIIRKRSLTLLSPEKVTIQNPRNPKKYRNKVNLSPNVDSNSPNDAGSTTSEDPLSS